MLFNRPHAIDQVASDDAGLGLARLGGLEGLGRSMLVTVLPLALLDSLDSKQAVSNAYLAASMVALAATLNVGRLETLLPRRWVLTIALVGGIAAAVLLLTVEGPALALAVAFVNVAAAMFAVLISLFVMDYVGKRDLVRNEGRRMVHNGLAWVTGPLVSITLYTEVAPAAAYLASASVMLVTLTYFWILRLGPNPALEAPKEAAPSPLANIVRYFGQRYLRIAYCITLVRGTFWASLFLYCPLYILEAGLPEKLTGGMVALVSALLLLSPLVLKAVDRTSTRTVICAGFLLIATGMAGLAVLGPARQLGLVFWLTAAVGASWLDVLGNIPFMRTVKPRERTAMTTVFSSWRETSSFAAPALGALVLVLGPFWVYYVVVATLAASTAAYATALPRRL